MRKDFKVRSWFMPQPVCIITTYNKDGTADAMNAAWAGICGSAEIIVSLGAHLTTENIRRTRAFTVSFANSEKIVPCDYVGVVSGKDTPDKMEKAGFTVTPSKLVDAPIINELPLCLECVLKEELPGGKFLGEVKNASVDESALDEDGNPDLSKIDPVVIDPIAHGYYKLGEKIAEGFKSGQALK